MYGVLGRFSKLFNVRVCQISQRTGYSNGLVQNFFKRENSTLIVDNRSVAVGLWLLGGSALICGTVVLGGYTRLNNAGLSMVKWKPYKDMIYPKSEEEWKELYEEYKNYPEYHLSSDDITLERFKQIFLLEFLHRILGRTTGAYFLLPSAIFFFKNKLVEGLLPRVIIYNALILLQGMMGWYMVKSGLSEDTMSSSGEPGVSQYRLAAHLGVAIALLALVFHQAVSILLPYATMNSKFNPARVKTMKYHLTMFALVLTMLYGALVAGLDAGKACNTWPDMNGKLVPEGYDELEPYWKNFFDNPITVQFIHRNLAYLSAFATILSCACVRFVKYIGFRAYLFSTLPVLLVALQIHTGINTVQTGAATEPALQHQLNALLTLMSVLLLVVELTRLKRGKFYTRPTQQ